jgi:hypothetical protein
VALNQMLVYVGWRALATTRCRRCSETDATFSALQEFLTQRYGQGA